MAHGTVTPFRQGGNWSAWRDRFDFYCEGNDIISEDKKRALLLSFCEEDIYEILCGIVLPRTIRDVPYKEIVQLLNERFEAKPSELVGRSQFYRRDQHQGESIDDFVSALKTLAKECNFGEVSLPETHPNQTVTAPTTTGVETTTAPGLTSTTSTTTVAATPPSTTVSSYSTRLPLNVMLRDRFVCGLKDTHLQQRLLSERQLTFRSAYDMAKAAEAAAKQQAQLRFRGTEAGVHAAHTDKAGAADSRQHKQKLGSTKNKGAIDARGHTNRRNAHLSRQYATSVVKPGTSQRPVVGSSDSSHPATQATESSHRVIT